MEESSSNQKIAAEDPHITYMEANLYKAAANGNIEILEKMSEDCIRFQMTPKKNTILHIAARFGQFNCVEFTLHFHWCSSLLRQPNLKGDTPLHIAAREGHFGMAKALICAAKALEEEMESGAITIEKAMLMRMENLEKETALHLAVRYHHCELVKLLIEEEDGDFSYGGNVRGMTPLYMAVERGFRDLVDVILPTCPSAGHTGIMGRTVLHAAVVSNDPEITKKILEWKPDLVKEVDENGWSPLHCAAYLGNITIVRQLLEKSGKCVVYLGIKNGNKTALHIAASQGHMNVVKELALHSPDCCEQVDNDGNNALHLVMKSKKNYFATDFLVDQWLSSRELINERNHEGNTPLHLLAHSQLDLSFFPSHRKVDKMTFNNENLTAMDIILSTKDLHGDKGSILRRLRSAKASVGPLGWQKFIKEEGNSSKSKDRCMVQDRQTSETKRIGEIHLIAATLIATVTFAAGFTLPGGYNDDEGSDHGMAILSRTAAFKAFVVTDTIALILSVSAVSVYFFMALHVRKEFLYKHLTWGFLLTNLAMAAMVVAFMTGLYAVLPHSSGIAAATCALCCCFFIFFGYTFRKIISSSRPL